MFWKKQNNKMVKSKNLILLYGLKEIFYLREALFNQCHNKENGDKAAVKDYMLSRWLILIRYF
jgi:hypothetical protein